MFHLEIFILDYWEKTWTENQQLIDTLFDGVEGLHYNLSFLIMQEGLDKNNPYESHWCVGCSLLIGVFYALIEYCIVVYLTKAFKIVSR